MQKEFTKLELDIISCRNAYFTYNDIAEYLKMKRDDVIKHCDTIKYKEAMCEMWGVLEAIGYETKYKNWENVVELIKHKKQLQHKGRKLFIRCG